MEKGYFLSLLNGENAAPFEDIGCTASESQHALDSSVHVPATKPNSKHKGKNFSDDEDRLLISAWLNVSTDPKQGTNQSRGTFWSRVHTYYHDNRESLPERTQISLQHRWGAIQDAVQKFCASIIKVESRNRSGNTIHDMVEEAEKVFSTLYNKGKPFQFRHCWLRLRNQPKWNERLEVLNAGKSSNKKQKIANDSSAGTSNHITIDSDSMDNNEDSTLEHVPVHVDPSKRPIGKKRAKDAARRGDKDVSIEALDILWAKKKESDAEKEIKKEERYAKTYALDKERLEVEQKRLANEEKRLLIEQEKIANEAASLQLKRMEEEERIMCLDCSSLNDLQKQYYMTIQEEILSRRMNSSS